MTPRDEDLTMAEAAPPSSLPQDAEGDAVDTKDLHWHWKTQKGVELKKFSDTLFPADMAIEGGGEGDNKAKLEFQFKGGVPILKATVGTQHPTTATYNGKHNIENS